MNTWPRDPSGAPIIPTRVLTLYAPWLYAILHLGKDVENRGSNFPVPREPEWVWLHASKSQSERQTYDEFKSVEDMARRAQATFPEGKLTLRDLLDMRGRVCGLVDLTGKVRHSTSGWFVGPLGLTLGARFALPEPSPVTNGALGLWGLPDDVQSALAEQAVAL